MSTYPYFVPQSDEQRVNHLARESEQARRDITNLQRQIDKSLGDVIPADGGGGGGAIAGTLTSTLSRGGTATLSTGDTVTDNTMIPGTIALPTGTYIVAVLDAVDGTTYWAIVPGWCFRLRGTLPAGAISSGSTGTVALANSMGNITARNRKGESTPTGSKGCECQWSELDNEWLISDWNCA